MPLPCPRCDVPLAERFANTEAGYSTPVHACETCAGFFIDGNDLTLVCPTLSHLPAHRDEVAILGELGAGISKCLRCEKTPHQYEIVGVFIDFCTHCGGVWLDGEEYEEGTLEERPRDRVDARNPYRAGIGRVAEIGSVDCVGCKVRVRIADTYARDEGLVCEECHREAAEEHVARVLGPGRVEQWRALVAGAVVRVWRALPRR